MLAVDMNVLVRMLVDDPTALARCEACKALSGAGEVAVSQVVQIETVRDLASAYGLNKAARQADGNMPARLNIGQRSEVARLDAVYVLHAFQKRTQTTSKRDVELVKVRLAQLMRGDV